ncbi:unnamed protein product [Lactuca saligna]|uniref:DUF8039 domain-containing protein n=1 Tax=Lactuca saligna TaxID=75948 RepID=A0AA35ZU15_LACSI|nr:unnamed protein product [Lactuca saligna]
MKDYGLQKNGNGKQERLINDYLKKGINPVPEYPYLDEPTWNAFVQLKTSPSFQEISNKATTTAKLNKYPPRIDPRGYRGMKPQWEKEMESGEATKFHNIRSERIEKDTQLSHGDWFPGPGADVLTEVLGPEHQDIKEKIKIKVEAMMEAKMEAKIEEMNAQMEEMKTYMQQFLSKNEGIHITSPVLKKNSVVSTVSNELDGIKTPTACELVIPYDTMNQKCAKGMVFPYGNGQIHSVPLNANHLKVSLDKIYDQYDCIPLPVSTEEAIIYPNQGTGYILDSQKNPDEKPVENYIIVKYVEEAVARLKEDIDTTHPMKWTLVEVKVLHGYLEPASC